MPMSISAGHTSSQTAASASLIPVGFFGTPTSGRGAASLALLRSWESGLFRHFRTLSDIGGGPLFPTLRRPRRCRDHPVPLGDVAPHTGALDVVPGVVPALRYRND